MKLQRIALALLSCALSAPALAQSPAGTDGADARIHWGPLRLNPTIALTNLGVDSNVFNENDANHPKRDFTLTVTPATDAWMHVGRSSLTASVREDMVYYQEFASERSVNGFYKAGVVVPLNRLSFSGGSDYISTRDRPGFEIDARSQHTESGSHAGLELRAFGKTFVTTTLSRSRVEFDADAVFMGASLQRELSRIVTSALVAVRHQLTPVTAVTLEVSHEDDRFLYNSERDSTSERVVGGVKFDTRLRGVASAGFRTFDPQVADVPGFRGLIANADVSFATVGATRFGVQVDRDVQYSYDFEQPYYLQTGGTVSVTQGLGGPFSGSVRAGVQQLAYRGRIGVAVPLADRVDVVSLFGGSVGYRVAGQTKVVFNLDKQERRSDLEGHGYGGLRFGTSVMYGF